MNPIVDITNTEIPAPSPSLPEIASTSGEELIVTPATPRKFSKKELRVSLEASTLDGVFSSIFGCVTGGVLLTDFLLHLGATNVEIGFLSALPMLMNFLQPVGAYIADLSTSRKYYNLFIFSASRSLWLLLVIGIFAVCFTNSSPHTLIFWTLGIIFASNILSALGAASWLSWMMVIVPHRLRGRYFGLRNSVGSFTSLVCVPLLGFVVSQMGSRTLEGYAIILTIGVIAGIISLICQIFKVDVNPQTQSLLLPKTVGDVVTEEKHHIWQDSNFLKFLMYFGLWTFALNLSTPFFNIYLLKNLAIDISWVTIYNSLSAGANLVGLLFWGKLADRLGNRVLLILVGMIVAILPLFWLFTGPESLSVWLFLPLIHFLMGMSWAAIDLCTNNIQMELASKQQSSSYFATAAAVAGICGAGGSVAGGFLAEFPYAGGLVGLFIISAGVRLLALLPLLIVKEPRGASLREIVQKWRLILGNNG